jgi:imidazolonepropionase
MSSSISPLSTATERLVCDSLWSGATLVTMQDGRYNLIENGVLAVKEGKIVWIGTEEHSPKFIATARHHFAGGIVTPGLVDCHTHLVFGGDRSAEFEQRLEGVSYAEIAAQGGGILSTVNATRTASQKTLFEQARFRLAPLLAEGVTCIEIKSGYGLSDESELKMLRVIRELADTQPVKVKATCLAAHALPPEYHGRADEYIEHICQHLLPHVAAEHLADAVDGFCEHLAFSPAQIERVFKAAKKLGLPG